MEWVIARLKEPSTWRGFIGLASAIGVALTPEQWDKITLLGVALIGVIEVFRKEKKVE